MWRRKSVGDFTKSQCFSNCDVDKVIRVMWGCLRGA